MKDAKPVRSMKILFSAKWLTIPETLAYSCIRSQNTLLKLIRSGKIYGTKLDGSGEYIIDRESIDRYYNAEREDLEIHLHRIRGRLRS